MKSSFLLTAVIILLSSHSFSQWKIINPQPFIDNTFVVYADSTTCDVITQRGSLASSSDGGISWVFHSPNINTDLWDVFFNGDNFGWAFGSGLFYARSFKTTDRGQNWIDKGNILEYAAMDICFGDSLNGWAAGSYYIKSTHDGGETWSTQQTGSSLGFISQYNDSILFTGGYDSLYRSTNRGVSWSASSKVPMWGFYKFTAIHSDTIDYGFLLYDDNNIDVTTDAGNTWSTVFPNYDHCSFNELKSNGRLLFGFGESNKIFRSSDFGNSWDTVYVPYAGYTDIAFASDNIIYISGNHGAFIKSTDGGMTFTDMTHRKISGYISYTSLLDSVNAYVTTDSQVYRTIDGGESFTEITPPGFITGQSKILAVTKDMAVAISDIKIYTTKDGGENWIVSSYGPPNTYNPLDIYFKDPLNGMVSCGWNLMRETTDGGDTWTNRFIGSGQQHLSSLSFPDVNNGFCCASDHLYNTTNGGTDWNLLCSLNPTLLSVKFIDLLNGVGEDSQSLYYTADGGLSWSKCDSISYLEDFDIMKNDSGSVLMVIANQYLYTSFDLGRTFTKEMLPFSNLWHVKMVDPATAWVSGSNGAIVWYHNPAIITGVKNDDISETGFRLLQNYPNPFNPSTNINYSISRPCIVTIKIYDVLGREIVVLVNESKPAGSYSVKLSGSGLASGIYFYQLRAGDFVKTNKMILLR